VSAVGGQVVFAIDQAHAGPFPVPGAMRELLAQTLSETLAELGFGLDVDQVQIRYGEMVISGTVYDHIPDLPVHVVN
jgi:hypothetical protein